MVYLRVLNVIEQYASWYYMSFNKKNGFEWNFLCVKENEWG
jgi:hypothetical protein